MMTEDVTKFVRGKLPPQDNRRLIRELLSVQPKRKIGVLHPLDLPDEEESGAEEGSSPGSNRSHGSRGSHGTNTAQPAFQPDYSAAFRRGSSFLQDRLAEFRLERLRVPDLLERLRAVPMEDWPTWVGGDAEIRCWSVGERLIDECQELLYTDTARAAALAEVAVAIAQDLDPGRYGDDLVHDLQARSWACLGNVLRHGSDLRSADAAFAVAESYLGLGTGDALEEAQLLELKAALYLEQRRLEEAHGLIDEVIAIYRHYRDFHLVGRAFVQKGRIHGAESDFEPAVRWLRKGLGLIDPTRERRLELSARHSLMLFLHQSGRDQEAWFLLKASRPEFLEHGGEMLQLQLRWLEGKIHQALGRLGEAEEALLESRRGFIAQGIGFSSALVSLDLAGLYAGQGRVGEMRRLAEEMLPIFQSRDIHREAIAALIVFQQAVRMERLSSDLLEQIRSYLSLARTDNKLRFEYPG